MGLLQICSILENKIQRCDKYNDFSWKLLILAWGRGKIDHFGHWYWKNKYIDPIFLLFLFKYIYLKIIYPKFKMFKIGRSYFSGLKCKIMGLKLINSKYVLFFDYYWIHMELWALIWHKSNQYNLDMYFYIRKI